MSDARQLLTAMMLASMMSLNEYSGQPIDFDLMDESEKPDADIEPIIEAEGGGRMSDLKSWNEFCAEKKMTPEGAVLTAIACPCCGNALYKDISTIRTSLFLEKSLGKYRYFCNKCKWSDYA